MADRRRRTFVLGALIFVVGAAVAAYFALSGDDDPGLDGPTTNVLVARGPIASGTTGSNAVAQNLVELRGIAAAAVPEGALVEVSQLAGKVAIVAVAPGQILTEAMFPAGQTRIGTLRIPPDRTALAVQLENVPGVAGFAGAGDRIDVYGVVAANSERPSAVRLVMPDIEVLSVNGTVLAPAQGQPGGTGLVFLLAVTPGQAEQLVYLASFERLYFALVPDDRGAVPSTPGVDSVGALGVG